MSCRNRRRTDRTPEKVIFGATESCSGRTQEIKEVHQGDQGRPAGGPVPESTTPIGPIPGPSNRFVSTTPPMPRGWQPPSDIHTYGPDEFAAIMSDLDTHICVQRARVLRERDQLAALQTERDYWEHLVHQRRHGHL